MNILILGGTGFLGRHIVDAAIRRGHSITLFNRGKTAAKVFPDIETIIGDREVSHDALKDRFWDAAIDTNGKMPKTARDAASVLKKNVSHYSFVSSLSAYDGGMSDPTRKTSAISIAETSPLAVLDEKDIDNQEMRTYGSRKAACEKWIGEEIGDSYLVIRPGLIVGPWDSTDRFTYWPVRMAEGGAVLAPGTGNDHVSFIDVRDLAIWTIKMIEEQRTGLYNAVGPAITTTMKQFLDTCKEVCNPNADLVWGDERFLETHEVRAWSDMPVWAPGLRPIEIKKAIDAGLVFRPLEATIRDTLQWATEEGMKRPLKVGLDAKREQTLLSRCVLS